MVIKVMVLIQVMMVECVGNIGNGGKHMYSNFKKCCKRRKM